MQNELTKKDVFREDGSMNHKYFELQIEQFLEEVIGTLSYAGVILMDRNSDDAFRNWIESAASEIRKLLPLMRLHPDYDENDEDFERASEYFHNKMREEFNFATIDYRPF